MIYRLASILSSVDNYAITTLVNALRSCHFPCNYHAVTKELQSNGYIQNCYKEKEENLASKQSLRKSSILSERSHSLLGKREAMRQTPSSHEMEEPLYLVRSFLV